MFSYEPPIVPWHCNMAISFGSLNSLFLYGFFFYVTMILQIILSFIIMIIFLTFKNLLFPKLFFFSGLFRAPGSCCYETHCLLQKSIDSFNIDSHYLLTIIHFSLLFCLDAFSPQNYNNGFYFQFYYCYYFYLWRQNQWRTLHKLTHPESVTSFACLENSENCDYTWLWIQRTSNCDCALWEQSN